MNITPLMIKENRLNSNPAILNLKSKLDLFLNDNIKTQTKSSAKIDSEVDEENIVLLKSYARSILSLQIHEIANKYGKNVNSPIAKYTLPEE
jgi:beta-glucosidase-like glycosyl hydrolase